MSLLYINNIIKIQRLHQRDGRMSWSKPQVHGGCMPLRTELIGRLLSTVHHYDDADQDMPTIQFND